MSDKTNSARSLSPSPKASCSNVLQLHVENDTLSVPSPQPARVRPLANVVIPNPNPKLKLMDEAREVLRAKHYAIRTTRRKCRRQNEGALGEVMRIRG